MLDQILPAEAFGFLLITTRMAAMVMLMPGLGDQSIPSRVRVLFALMVSLIVYTSVRDTVPPIPASVWGLTFMLFKELMIGAIMGTITRYILTAAHTMGSIVAMQTGLAAAQSFDPSQGGQSAIVAAFLTVTTITMIFVTDIHHLMIMGLHFSYQKFPIGISIPVEDFMTVAAQYVSSSFILGVQLASPFMVYAFIFNLSLGLIARMNPQFQVFFIGMPLNIFMGFLLLSILLPSLVMLLLTKIREFLMLLLG